MTRINVVHVKSLCDQHLLSEHRELTRIPRYIVKKKGKVILSRFSSYVLGREHVIFFRNKLLFLYYRYLFLHQECLKRGFYVLNRWPKEVEVYDFLWQDYVVTKKDIKINQDRIKENMPKYPRFTHYSF